MVSILDKVHIADLEDIDRWQIGLTAKAVDASPAFGIDVTTRQKGAVKVPVASHATNYLVEWDLLEGDVLSRSTQVKLFLHLVKRKEVVGAARKLG
jgi:hypothetical protein